MVNERNESMEDFVAVGNDWEEGPYRAKLLDIKKLPSNFEQPYFYAWEFEILEGPLTGRTDVSGGTDTRFKANTKPRNWAEAVLGRKIADGERFGVNDLIGCECLAKIGEKEKKGAIYPKVVEVYPLREEQKGVPAASGAAKQQPTEEEDDFDSIPF